MSTTTRLITADELLTMSHRDGRSDIRLELVRGKLKKSPLAGAIHGIISARLLKALATFVKANDFGVIFGTGTGFVVERHPDTVFGVDVAVVSHQRLNDVENLDNFIPFAPDLAIEILSPSNTVNEMDEKIALYFAAGSRAVWVFNPKRRTVALSSSPFDVRILGEQETLDGGEVLPGFTLDLKKLFAAVKK